jgi:very-short-patch-repair endonuclease
MSKETPYLKYDTRLKQRARELRKNQTPAEKYIWNKILRNKQFF